MSGHEPMTVPVEPLTLAWRQAHVREAERALVEAETAGTGHHYGQGMLWCAIAQAHAAIANVRGTDDRRVTYREGGPVRSMIEPEHPWLTGEATARMAANPPGHDAITRAVAGDIEIVTSNLDGQRVERPYRYGMPDRDRRPGA